MDTALADDGKSHVRTRAQKKRPNIRFIVGDGETDRCYTVAREKQRDLPLCWSDPPLVACWIDRVIAERIAHQHSGNVVEWVLNDLLREVARVKLGLVFCLHDGTVWRAIGSWWSEESADDGYEHHDLARPV